MSSELSWLGEGADEYQSKERRRKDSVRVNRAYNEALRAQEEQDLPFSRC